MFKGLGNLGNIASMVGKLQEIPQKMQELNEQMRSERVSASSSCNHVEVVMNGIGEVQSVEIAPEILGVGGGELVAPEDLQHAIRDATNAAGRGCKATVCQRD
ncbi:YbaB/EbfC family nucleoid-associated protein [Rhodopirellula europaea]|uniref:YbaB/EbfC family nucleoid-associated protein n=1 Tax=Rhodopirellula europaea TaxID=1263866 RepID=UPI003D27A8CA